MKRNDNPKNTYLPPQVEEYTICLRSFIAASGDPDDWNDGGIDDNFNDLFDFDQ